MKKTIISIAVIVIAVGLSVCAWFMLPPVVAVQIGLDGQAANTLPKLPAIAIPLVISVAGSVMNLTNKENGSSKGFVLGIVGIAVILLTLFVNR